MTDQTAGPDRHAALAGVPTDLFIGGAWTPRDNRFEVLDPSTDEVLATVADGTADDALAALDAAVSAQQAWATTPPVQRADILWKAWDLMNERADQFAQLITLEMGKPVAESRGEVKYAADYVRWFAEEATRIGGEYRTAPTGDTRIITMRQPVGPVLLIAPWNFPLAMITRKVAPAIAAGCTMVIKPAHETPLTALLMAQVFADAGVPAGVLNVVTTTTSSAISETLLADERIRKVSFTGSTGVGSTLLKLAAQNIVRSSMELGGNAPFLVFDDADLDRAVEGAMVAKFRNGGESCVAANRIMVQQGIADEFVARLTARMDQVVLGDGFDPESTVGPMITSKQRDRVQELVDDAVRRGATLVRGGRRRDGVGNYFEPTLLTSVPRDARISVEEIFGPVAAVSTFTDADDALAAANASEFGLTSFVFTQSLDRALGVAEKLESGMVGVNRGLVSNAAAPFGGVKASGLGREGGFEGIGEYLVTKYVSLDAAGL